MADKLKNIKYAYLVIAMFATLLIACHTTHSRHETIPNSYYDLLDTISDTIALSDQNSARTYLHCYKKQTIRKNRIIEGYEQDFYHEFDSYKAYFRSDSMKLIIEILSIENPEIYAENLHYRFRFILDTDTAVFEIYRDSQFENDEIIQIAGNGFSQLSIRKSVGIVSITTQGGKYFENAVLNKD